MRHLLLLAWSVALCAGAAFVRLGYPQRHSRLFSEVLAAESAHVIAHLGLYGTFAALLAVRSPPWRVLGLTLGLGVAQELVQVAGRREFGSPEWFDLTYRARYIGSSTDVVNPVKDARTKAIIYHDLEGTYRLPSLKSDISIGVSNIFDKMPPASYANAPINFDIYTYDVRGRYVYARVSSRF